MTTHLQFAGDSAIFPCSYIPYVRKATITAHRVTIKDGDNPCTDISIGAERYRPETI
ncbi:hypothetical protein L1889_18340 [Paenalcaligenes niemegkensis]|uniref:hypothetical protein n=1 Tax=Paenalcaligenes niemegkensis TaxID=2895469 RepID=UPI001EE80E12|nr:hypothetical protein [Paenalcaligenes niemegkensis]MCQ9618400.1 hypothetical protein [Paenalcaligenes niemegkensis]